MPCFTCAYAHSCKYYQNIIWDDIILKNGICPVMYNIPFNYIYDYIEEMQNKKKSIGYTYQPTFFSYEKIH